MYKVRTFNQIALRGLERFPRDNYEVGSDVPDPDALLLRSQQLGDPSDISGYHLIPADRAVAQFFSLRHRLLREAKERPPANP